MEDEKLLRNFTHITIPAAIWLRRDISMQAKALWAELFSLHDNTAGGCFASDEYLMNFLGLKRSRLHEVYKELKECGLMEIVNFNGRRTIRRALEPPRNYTNGQQLSGKPDTCYPENRTPDVRKTGFAPYIENKEENKGKSASSPSFGLATFFFEKLKEINPKIRKPDLIKWSKEIERLLYTDERLEIEVKDVINFIVTQHKNPKGDFTWSKAIASPQKLRQHFARIWMDMQSEISKEKSLHSQEIISPVEIANRRSLGRILENKNRDALKRDIYVNDMHDHFICGNDKLYYSDIKFYELLEHLIRKYQLKK